VAEFYVGFFAKRELDRRYSILRFATMMIAAYPTKDGDIQDLSAFGKARATIPGSPLSPEEVEGLDLYWQASLYLSLGIIISG